VNDYGFTGSDSSTQGHGDKIWSPNETGSASFNGPVTEMFWWCGDSHERVANDEPFDGVFIRHKNNGAIKWFFYRWVAQ